MNIILITVGENISVLEKDVSMIRGLLKNNVKVFPFHFSYNIDYFHSFINNYKIYDFNWNFVEVLFKGSTKIEKLLNNMKLSLSFYLKLKTLIKQYKIDAIIVPCECITEILCTLKIFSKINNIPIIAHIVEYRPSLPGYNYNIRKKIRWKFLVKFADAYIVISKWLMNKLSIYKKPLFYLPIIFDPSMVDIIVDKIRNISDIKIINMFSQKPVLIYSSSSNYADLLEFSLKALSFLKDQDFLLVITGNYTEEQKKYWQSIIKTLNLENKVIFSGYLKEKEFFTLMKNSTALLIPLLNNVQHQARFPQKILDYIYLEKPIISTKVGEIGEHFIDGETAFLDDTITPQGYSKKIEFVLKNPNKAEIVAKNAKKYILTNFHYLKCTKDLKSFIDKICSENIF